MSAQSRFQKSDFRYQKQTGFTLIELLVVIAIIAILATVGLVTYSSVQKAARISKRLQDIQAIQAAVETYKTSTGYYPKVTAIGVCIGLGTSLAGALTPVFTPGYMQTLPKDPSSVDAATAPCYRYQSDANGTEYKIWSVSPEMTDLEYRAQTNYLDPKRDTGTVDCTVEATAITAWAIYSGTAACAY